MTAEEFLAATNVSRETLEKLKSYEARLLKWNPAINLVSRNTLTQVWARHFLDSAQIFDLAQNTANSWIDLGSGGGFPGMVVAIMAQGAGRDLPVTLVESDRRKCAFLADVSRETSCPIQIIPKRAESLTGEYDIISARAFAPLLDLFAYAEPLAHPNSTLLFPKGARWQDELTTAQKHWHMNMNAHPSRSDPDAAILTISDFRRRNDP